jgi:diguanylate cyclase (GGDEF)-like protein
MPRAIILVVDQDAVSRQMICDTLAGEISCDTATAASAYEALQCLNGGRVDILITPVAMAVGGLALLRHALDLPTPPEVILTTGSTTLAAAMQALEQGVRDYLLKPCDPAKLRHTVRSCLEQRRLVEEIRRLRTQVHLFQTGRQLSSQQDIEVLLSETVAVLRAELGGNVRSLAFLANGEEISHLVNTGLPEEQARALAETLLPRLQTVSKGYLLEAIQLLAPEAAAADVRALWLFPLQADNGIQGALTLINGAGRSFPAPFPQESLAFLAEQATLGFQNACRYLRAREMVYTDDLTELFNHRYLQIALEQEVRRAERYDLQFTVAFIDIDQFKLVNDNYGHLVGSNMLREVGQVLRQCVRNADLLFRYGGDEFTALLVETDSSGGKVVAERIRKAIADHPFDSGQGKTHPLTATVGYATYPIHATSRQGLIDLSDRAMYQGKKVRNISCSAGEVDLERCAAGDETTSS